MNIEILHIEQAGVVLTNVTMNVSQASQQAQEQQDMKACEETDAEEVKDEEAGAEGVKGKDTVSVPATDCPKPLRNAIFKSSVIDPDTHQQRELQLVRLYNWIGEHFVSRLSARYEWFALWRMLYDKKLIEGTRAMTSKFAKQMNDWYPDAPYPCIEGEVNRFRNGYLGQTPFSLWDENAYLSKLHGKQSYSAFRQLYDLCEDLKNTLKTDDFYQ